jgi:hypothetical protein
MPIEMGVTIENASGVPKFLFRSVVFSEYNFSMSELDIVFISWGDFFRSLDNDI